MQVSEDRIAFAIVLLELEGSDLNEMLWLVTDEKAPRNRDVTIRRLPRAFSRK
jgi:hypothetical protein